MKKLVPAFCAFGVIALMIASCGKMVPAKTSDNTMIAVVDSNNFNATGGSVTAYKNGGQLIISGTSAQNVKIVLNVSNFTGFDAVNTIDNYAVFGTMDSGSGPKLSIANIGYINITETAPYLKGTFFFVCSDSTYVTHGNFYCVAPTP